MKLTYILKIDRQILFSSLLAFSIKFAGAVSIFFMNLVVARTLGIESVGYFLLGLTYISFVSAIVRCGMDSIILRHTASALHVGDSLFIPLFFFRCAGFVSVVASVVSAGIFFGAEFIAVYFFNKPDLAPVISMLSPAILPLTLLWLLAHSYQGLGRFSLSIISTNVAINLMLIVGVLTFGISDAKTTAFMYSLLTWLTFIFFFIFWFFSVSSSNGENSYQVDTRTMLVSAMPLWVVLVMSQLVQWAGQLIGGILLPPDQVAQLALAQRTSMLVSFILMSVNFVVAPKFASMYLADNFEGLKNTAFSAAKLTLFVATPILLFMLFFPGFLMGMFGNEFSVAGNLLRVLAIGQFINVLTGSVGYLLTMSGHERDLRNSLLFLGPISVFLTLILTLLYGAMGSAISTAISVSAQNLLATYWVKRRLGFNTLTFLKLLPPR